MAFRMATVLVGLSVALSIVSILIMPMFCFVNTSTTFHICGWLQALSGMTLLGGCLIYPVGWNISIVQDVCGPLAGEYSQGNCAIRWAFVLAAIGVADSVVLSILAFVLGSYYVRMLPKNYLNSKVREPDVDLKTTSSPELTSRVPSRINKDRQIISSPQTATGLSMGNTMTIAQRENEPFGLRCSRRLRAIALLARLRLLDPHPGVPTIRQLYAGNGASGPQQKSIRLRQPVRSTAAPTCGDLTIRRCRRCRIHSDAALPRQMSECEFSSVRQEAPRCRSSRVNYIY
ncbi:lipoma HMGIC fusion partner 4 protein-like [Tropilaelaps mercedesae]|uniref:Lipoma HMGIC fusion partner 4 protein-like n=1 Tax=Tropilaelaps mercedesae TaxID=418985 RepID=A0A1V9XKZ9_9ACAR|nr:lipoma HMGIC fusion partner 4 protein-like [Tropilaelaps mercedesae]